MSEITELTGRSLALCFKPAVPLSLLTPLTLGEHCPRCSQLSNQWLRHIDLLQTFLICNANKCRWFKKKKNDNTDPSSGLRYDVKAVRTYPSHLCIQFATAPNQGYFQTSGLSVTLRKKKAFKPQKETRHERRWSMNVSEDELSFDQSWEPDRELSQ